MTIPSTPILIGGAAVLLFTSGYMLGRHRSTPVSVQVAQNNVDTAKAHVAAVDTVLKVKEKVVGVSIAAYRDVRTQLDSALALLSARLQTHPETTQVAAHQDSAALQVVQNTIAKCDTIASSCADYKVAAQAKFHADSGLFAAQAQEISAWKASQPSKLKQGIEVLGLVAGAFALGHSNITLPFLH